MVTAKEYRARARAQLGGNIFANNWLMALVLCLIYSAAISIGSYVIVGAILVEGFLMVGLVHAFLAVVRGEKDTFEVADLIRGKDRLGELFLLSLLKNIFLFLWLCIPIVGFVKTFSYSMVYYIKHDHPEYDWRTCITESRRMMDGNKWRLFCLTLSFIGWLFVGALCLGVGTLWVAPYMQAAQANFYEDLKKAEDAKIAAETVTAEAASSEGATEAQ